MSEQTSEKVQEIDPAKLVQSCAHQSCQVAAKLLYMSGVNFFSIICEAPKHNEKIENDCLVVAQDEDGAIGLLQCIIVGMDRACDPRYPRLRLLVDACNKAFNETAMLINLEQGTPQ